MGRTLTESFSCEKRKAVRVIRYLEGREYGESVHFRVEGQREEHRFVTIGTSHRGEVLVVVHAERGDPEAERKVERWWLRA